MTNVHIKQLEDMTMQELNMKLAFTNREISYKLGEIASLKRERERIIELMSEG